MICIKKVKFDEIFKRKILKHKICKFNLSKILKKMWLKIKSKNQKKKNYFLISKKKILLGILKGKKLKFE